MNTAVPRKINAIRKSVSRSNISTIHAPTILQTAPIDRDAARTHRLTTRKSISKLCEIDGKFAHRRRRSVRKRSHATAQGAYQRRMKQRSRTPTGHNIV
jgi:hypothetical protein